MSYLLPSRADELLAKSRLRLGVDVGLLTGHTTVTAHVTLGDTERQHCRLCGDEKEHKIQDLKQHVFEA